METNHHTFNYIELPTINMAPMKAFYAKVFGWTFIDYGPTYASFQGAGLDGGFDANPNAVGGRQPSANGALVILYSDDLESSEKIIRDAGGVISVKPFDFPGGRRFHFTDPSGNELAVWTKAT